MEAAWFAGRLRELREQKGLTQDQLATLAGVKRDAVGRWESGRREPAWSNVVALCRALSVGADAFLERPTRQYVPLAGRPKAKT
jgi:transcriptional regulator with XRE-family HTH domain